ncbi:Neurotransmitter-gated ion-channel transmembrane domain [Trinorchestia longiramus]|nr:Neurotransmitter-gated ion-channel transmembrane domain [Trinorchestia longiramus]
MISLSPCQDGYFTCDNAVCIPLQERCDLKYDCQDHSDETQCDLVFFPQEYRSDLPPTGSEGSPLSISLLLSLHSMGVETSRTQFYATHELAMQWHDHRLVFRNMKDEATLNVIPQTDMHRIWTPMVGFVNTENNDHSRVDEEATLVALKTTPMAGWNESSSTEGNGGDGGIGGWSNYLQFKEDEMRAEYLGPELLIEYQVGSLKMVFSNATEGEVRFEVTLGRRSGYAILTIYIPSLILLIISYVTLFFRAKIFEVRVMAALTSLLVVATLFTQASSSLPKTSYFKMVDIWLLFCIGVIFLIIICHALIDAILSQSQVEDFDTADITRNFLKKNVHNDLAPIVSMWKKHRKSGRKKKADPRRRGQVSTTRVMVRPYEGQRGWVAAGGGVTAGGNRNVDAFIYGDQKCWQETDSVAISQCFRRQQSFNEKVNEESEYDNDTLKEDEGREDDTLKREASKIVSSDQVDRPYSSAEKLIKASKILILILVALFNIIYWSYINS